MISYPIGRRMTLQGAAAVSILAAPTVLRAQPAAVKIGILQPVTGALAQDGELGHHTGGVGVGDRRFAVLGGHVVIGDTEGQVRPCHRRFALPQLCERVVRAFMDKMAVDPEKGLAVFAG